MNVQTSAVHILMYATIVFWLLSTLPRRVGGRWRRWSFFLGGVAMLLAFVLRWIGLGHVPLQSLFDVFLALGVAVVPLWWFCERCVAGVSPARPAGILLPAPGEDDSPSSSDQANGTRNEGETPSPRAGGTPAPRPLLSHAAAASAGVCVLIPAGLVFPADTQTLPPALQSLLFVPHVGAYMLAYMILFLAGLTAAKQLLTRGERAWQLEQLSHRMVRLGFPLLTLGLVLGAVWGKLCWGDYWNWDPKELWSLATWLTFAAYLHWRSWHGGRFAKTNALLVLLGLACVVLTLLWVNLSRLFPGLHMYA